MAEQLSTRPWLAVGGPLVSMVMGNLKIKRLFTCSAFATRKLNIVLASSWGSKGHRGLRAVVGGEP